MNESNIIEWPEAFKGDDSEAWRDIQDYSERMKMIAFFCSQNAAILNEER